MSTKQKRKGANQRSLSRELLDLRLVDSAKLLWHIRRKSVSKSQFADDVQIGRTSLYRMLEGQPVKYDTVAQVARCLQIPVDDLLVADPGQDSAATLSLSWHHPEWDLVPGSQLPYEAMSNGLVMRVAKVRHRQLSDEFGRAKIYDITGMPGPVRHRCRDALTRHAAVCRKLRSVTYISQNLTMTSLNDDTIWTTVDEWIEGETLATVVGRRSLSRGDLLRIISDIGSGIRDLHNHHIIARELCPRRVLIPVDGSHCRLTDLELAKLLGVEGTVSANWQANPFRAPEIAGGDTRFQADVYSLARMFVFAIAGVLPDYPDDQHLLADFGCSKSLTQWLDRALSPSWRKRPESVDELLQLILLQLEVPIT